MAVASVEAFMEVSIGVSSVEASVKVAFVEDSVQMSFCGSFRGSFR